MTAPSLDRSDPNPTGWTIAAPTMDIGDSLWMTKVNKYQQGGAMVGQWDIPVRVSGTPGNPGTAGPPGINGTSGPSPRLLEFVPGATYENGDKYIDYAYFRSSNTATEGWYIVKLPVGHTPGTKVTAIYPGGIPDTASATNSFVKTPFTKEMSFGTVVAEQANLAGFVFRNQVLYSQAGANNSTCHPFPGEFNANLSLNGLQGIIKFLDRMVMDVTGIILKDDCGRKRMAFQWVDGLPILRFYDELGNITWEAGKDGYVIRTQGTTQPSWSPNQGFRKITTLTDEKTADFSSTSSANYVAARNFIINNYITTAPNNNTPTTPHPVRDADKIVYFITWAMPNTGPFASNTGPASYYSKGDIITNENHIQAYYIQKTPVTSVPSSNLLPDGWYLQEGITGSNGGELRNRTISYTHPTEVVDYYAPIVYIKNGNVVREVEIQIHRRTYNT